MPESGFKGCQAQDPIKPIPQNIPLTRNQRLNNIVGSPCNDHIVVERDVPRDKHKTVPNPFQWGTRFFPKY